MKTYIKLLLLLGGPLFIVRSASAQISQSLPEFNRIRIVDNIQVELVIADRYSIYIEDKAPNQDNIFVTNGVLSLDAGNARGSKVKVFTKSVEQIILDGAARIESLDTIKGERIQLQLDGASKAKLNIMCTSLKTNIDGGSEVIAAGKTGQLSLNADGAAQFRGQNLTATDVTVNTDGAAQARFTVTGSLTAKADGTSQVKFNGNPTTRNFSVDALGKIESLDTQERTDNIIIEEDKEVVTNDGDTTRVKIGKRRLMIIEDKDKEETYGTIEEPKQRKMKSVWGGFELGVQGFSTPQMDFTMPAKYSYLTSNFGKSWFFGLNLPELDGQIVQNKLAVTTGLGILWSNIRFDGNDYITPGIDSMAATTPAPGINLSKNKLYTFDITAPLLIKWAPGTRKKAKGGFHIAVGTILHYVAIKRVVTETSSLGYDQRNEIKDDFNMYSFRADATVRMGFDRIKLFANYSLTPYFNTNKAPDVRLFAAGITLIGF
jgi:hypothetical protein